MKAKKQTLSNGVRLITIPMKDNPALTVMVLSAVGSNNERGEQQGMAHFLEHMAMKGGEKYSSPYAVSSTLDALGAESNAFTSEECTAYYAKGHPKHFAKMLDVLADVYRRPRLEAEELEKERGVVIEEINLRDDLPMAKASHLLNQVMYGDQPAGWHTLGTKEVIRSIDRSAMVGFHRRHYSAGNTIVLVAGDLPRRGLLESVKKHFADMPTSGTGRRPKPKVKQSQPQVQIIKQSTDQIHFRLGLRTFPARDKRQPALRVLDAVLGGGMSSRLFQKLREEMGVCYYVRSQIDEHDTYGRLIIAAGVDTKRFSEVIKVVMAELDRLKNDPIGHQELQKAKDYLIGHLYLDLETSTGLADFYLDQELLTDGDLKTPARLAGQFRAVTVEDIKKLSRKLFTNDNLNLSAVGNVRSQSSLRQVLKL